MSSSEEKISIINGINLAVSVGLLALGIVLIIYGFKIPDKKCDSNHTTDCLNASNGVSGEDIHEDVEVMRLVGLITGFILIIPFALNITEMGLKYIPGTGGITGALGSVSGTVNQKSYAMKHHGGYTMDGGYGMNSRSY